MQKAVDIYGLLLKASRERQVSPLKITVEILRRAFGKQRLTPLDFFAFRLYRADLTAAERDAFVSETEITALNTALRPAGAASLSGLISNKLLTELLLKGAGLPTSKTLAVAQRVPASLPFPVLTSAAAVEAFLRDKERLPIFGKPNGASLGIGAASFLRLEGDDLVLGDGSRSPVKVLSAEIARDYPDGYLFQDILVPHPELERLIGPIIGTLRVLSLWLREGPKPLFVMLKMPGPGAMVDGALSGSNAAALVDPKTGRILRAQLLSAPIGEDLAHSHVTGAPLPGAELPDFAQALALARAAHLLFPNHGVFGFDIMLTAKGPVINEINSSPLSSLVQNARGNGLYDDAIKASYREALAVQGVRLPIKGVRL
ncbi:MAG: hypothetical protein JNK19_09275 [Tabrizicola sp.]|nr:hypothetical protein [Tabrizicola sp.]